MLREPDPDLGQAVVHPPLQTVWRVLHLRLDRVQQSVQVHALGLLLHPLGDQRPARTGHHRIGVIRPLFPQLLGVLGLLDHVVDQPVEHLGRARLPQHRIQLLGRELLGPHDQQCQQPRGRVPGLPQLHAELMVGLDPLGHRTQLGQVHPVVIAVPLVHGPRAGILQRRELVHQLLHRGSVCSGVLRRRHVLILPLITPCRQQSGRKARPAGVIAWNPAIERVTPCAARVSSSRRRPSSWAWSSPGAPVRTRRRARRPRHRHLTSPPPPAPARPVPRHLPSRPSSCRGWRLRGR